MAGSSRSAPTWEPELVAPGGERPGLDQPLEDEESPTLEAVDLCGVERTHGGKGNPRAQPAARAGLWTVRRRSFFAPLRSGPRAGATPLIFNRFHLPKETDMKIADVKAMTLKGYKQWNYVQIETDEGLTGIGEAHPGAGIAEIILQFKGILVGRGSEKCRTALQPHG